MFVGLDLAWTRRHASGVCVLEGDAHGLSIRRLDTEVASPTAMAGWLAGRGQETIVAIDAPLRMCPGRDAEALLGQKFARAKAGAYHVSREWLSRRDMLAGPQLAEALAARGFAWFTPGEPHARQSMFETLPHAAHVALFGLSERLAYKRGTLAARRAALETYARWIEWYLAESRLLGGADCRSGWLQALLEGARSGGELKAVEDRFDALTCALVAVIAGRDGGRGVEAFGTREFGQIVAPRGSGRGYM